MSLPTCASLITLLCCLALQPVQAQSRLAQNWQDLSPRERFDAMRNYRQHRQLPEERQQDMEQRYERWRQMSPDEQLRIRRNYDRLRQLGPQERDQFERRYQRWKQRTGPRQ